MAGELGQEGGAVLFSLLSFHILYHVDVLKVPSPHKTQEFCFVNLSVTYRGASTSILMTKRVLGELVEEASFGPGFRLMAVRGTWLLGFGISCFQMTQNLVPEWRHISVCSGPGRGGTAM